MGPAVGALAMILASACATGGDGALRALDGPEAGAAADGSDGDSASHFDSSTAHDSSPGVDAATGVDAGIDGTTGSDSGGVDATTPDSSAIDSSVDSAADSNVEAGPCAQSCMVGCCDTNGVCQGALNDTYCPTTNVAGGRCESCATQGLNCIFFLQWICL